MIVTDTEEILKVELKYPELMASNASELFFSRYNTLKDRRKNLSEQRMKMNIEEQEIKALESELKKLSEMFNITYKTKEINEIKNESLLSIINREDARNN